MLSAINRDLQTAQKRHQVISVARKRLKEKPLLGVVVVVTSDLVLLHRLDDGIRLDGYSLLRSRDVTRVDLELPRAKFYHEALRLRRQRPRRPRGIDLTELAAGIMSAGLAFPLVAVHPERKHPGICWIGRPLAIQANELVLAYITPGATWEGEHHCRLSDVTRIDFGGAYEESLALVAEARSSKSRARRTGKSKS